MSAREIVLSAVNASTVPLKREEIVFRVRNEYGHQCHEATVYKWLYILSRQGRIVKLDRALYASQIAAQRWREEDNLPG